VKISVLFGVARKRKRPTSGRRGEIKKERPGGNVERMKKDPGKTGGSGKYPFPHLRKETTLK